MFFTLYLDTVFAHPFYCLPCSNPCFRKAQHTTVPGKQADLVTSPNFPGLREHGPGTASPVLIGNKADFLF